MLIERLAGALITCFLALTLGPGAAEFGAVSGGLLLRPLLFDALPELVQIDQIPHVALRHAETAVDERMHSIDERVRGPVISSRILGGYAQAGSTVIL